MFGEGYRLTLRVFTLTQGFSREFKYTLGQEMKRDCLVLLRSTYRINRSRERALEFPPLRRQRRFGCQAAIAGAVGRVLS